MSARKIAFINRASDDELALLQGALGGAVVIGCFKDARIEGAEFLHCETAAEAQVLGLLCCLANDLHPFCADAEAKDTPKSQLDPTPSENPLFSQKPAAEPAPGALAAAAARKIAQIAAALDAGELSGESCFGEEEAEGVLAALAAGAPLLLSAELAEHPQAANVFVYAALLAARFSAEVFLGAKPYTAAEFAAFCAPFRPAAELASYAFDGIVLYACLAPAEPPRISPAAARLAAAKKLDLPAILGAAPVQDAALKGLFILTPRCCGYSFSLLKEPSCK